MSNPDKREGPDTVYVYFVDGFICSTSMGAPQSTLSIEYTRTDLHEKLEAKVGKLLAERFSSTDPNYLGQLVRMAWVKWAKTQPNPKPSWLVPWSELPEADKEADRQIGKFVADRCVMPELLRVEAERDAAKAKVAALEADNKRLQRVSELAWRKYDGAVTSGFMDAIARADEAHDLEAERTRPRHESERLLRETRETLDEYVRDNSALEADGERLDWIETRHDNHHTHSVIHIYRSHAAGAKPTLREVLDAARKKGEG